MPLDIKTAKEKELAALKEKQGIARSEHKNRVVANKPVYKMVSFVGESNRLSFRVHALWRVSEKTKVLRKIKSLQKNISGPSSFLIYF